MSTSTATATYAARDARQIALSLGEWHVSADPNEELRCLGLGSCVAFCAYDPAQSIAGMAHMVLPDSAAGRAGASGSRFVDMAVPLVIDAMEQLGARRSQLVIHLVGGAHMLKALTVGPITEIGRRNAEAARAALAALKCSIKSEDVGGDHGRTVSLHVGTGNVSVSTAGNPPVVLR